MPCVPPRKNRRGSSTTGRVALRAGESWNTLRSLWDKTEAPSFVDLNLREPWWTTEKVDWCLSTADWIKLNDTELAELTASPTGSFEECRDAALGLARDHAIQGVIVTRGPRGALSVVGGKRVFEATAPPVTSMVDTVGAGDAFSAVVCLGLLHEWDYQTTLDRAASFAADLCTVRGATTPDFGLV